MYHTPSTPKTQTPLTLTNPTSDLADYLVRKGVPFRETHHISGQVVALAESKNLPMDQLSHADLQSVDKRLGSDFIFDYEKSVEMRTASGGTVSASSFPVPCLDFRVCEESRWTGLMCPFAEQIERAGADCCAEEDADGAESGEG